MAVEMDGVPVPVDLLLDSTLTASAKVIWMALRLYPELTKDGRPSPTRLAALTGLSRPTVRKGLARLAEAGWFDPSSQHHDSSDQTQSRSQSAHASTPQRRGSFRTLESPRADSRVGRQINANRNRPETQRLVTIPRELLEDRSVKPQAVVMYGVLQATPEFEHPDGKYTCKQLRELTGRALKTIRRATAMLARRGWLKHARKNHLCPFSFTVRNPIMEECLAELAQVKKRIERATFLGEALAQEFSTLTVDSDKYQDNCRPGFCVNVFTGERMEFDRLYFGRLAIEFNGPHHYEATEYASAEDVAKQRARDAIKAMICKDEGIPLVVIHPEDLTLKTMIEKLSPYLPMRDLRNKGPIIQYLEDMAERYRQAIRRQRRSTAKFSTAESPTAKHLTATSSAATPSTAERPTAP